MIWKPKEGQLVTLRYRSKLRDLTGLHGRFGMIDAASCGPGPINALVWIPGTGWGDDCARLVVIPRGHLFLHPKSPIM